MELGYLCLPTKFTPNMKIVVPLGAHPMQALHHISVFFRSIPIVNINRQKISNEEAIDGSKADNHSDSTAD